MQGVEDHYINPTIFKGTMRQRGTQVEKLFG